MKRIPTGLLSSVLLMSTMTMKPSDCSADVCNVVSCFIPRSQSREKLRQVVGMFGKTHLLDHEEKYATLSVMPIVTQTSKSHKISECLFGDDFIRVNDENCRTIKIQGSDFQGDSRDPKAWLADYFYLPTDYEGFFTIDPVIRNFVVNFDYFMGLDCCAEGMYFRAFMPIVHTRWDLNFCEQVCNSGKKGYRPGYFNAVQEPDIDDNFTPEGTSGIDNAQLLQSFGAYACGLSIEQPEDDCTIYQPLRYLRIPKCTRTKTGVAEMRFELGYDFHCTDCSFFGVNFQIAAPTGNHCRACYLFDPIVGNGNHWEAGAGFYGYYNLWSDEDSCMTLLIDGNLTHMFKANQQRTFDLCGKPNSKYMLAARYDRNIYNLSGPTPEPLADRQFAAEYAPVANLTTLDVSVRIGVQADIVAWLNYTCNNLSVDLGYNFWAKSCEKIKCKCEADLCDCLNLCDGRQDKTWALKGDARMYGFYPTDGEIININGIGVRPNQAIPLSATEYRADIHNGTNQVVLSGFSQDNNRNVDNNRIANVYEDPGELTALVNEPGNAIEINTSIQPIFIDCEDINFQRSRGISHQLFAHFSYTCEDNKYQPYGGFGASVEFGRTDDCCKTDCNPPCDTPNSKCINCAVNQWSIWLKGGFFFDSLCCK